MQRCLCLLDTILELFGKTFLAVNTPFRLIQIATTLLKTGIIVRHEVARTAFMSCGECS